MISRLLALSAAALAAALGMFAPGPIGHVAAYLAIGLIPGWAAAMLLLPGAARSTHVLLAALLGPLVSTVIAWAILSAGGSLLAATQTVAALGVLGIVLGWRSGGAASDEEPPLDRIGWGVLIAAVAFVAVFPLASEWLRIRSDGWIHAGIAWDIHEHGIPPIDPRFAGMRLNYVWFYNLFLAMISSPPHERDLFVTMAMMNLVDMAALIALTWRLAARWGGGALAARGAALLAVLGMNAGAWILFPLHLLRAVHGEHSGWAEAAPLMQQVEWDTYRVQHYVISSPFAWMVNSWDKWTLGSSIGYTYLFIPLHLWALLRAWGAGQWGWWALVAISAGAMILFHGVVGLSVLPVTGLTLLALFLVGPSLRGAPARRQSLLGGILLALGGLAVVPYLISITAGWEAGQSGLKHSYLRPSVFMVWTLVTSCAVAAIFAWKSLRKSLRATEPPSALLPLWLLGMLLFSLVVHLPENNETKFVWQVFILLAVIGGASAWEWVARSRQGAARARWVMLVLAIFVLPSVLFLQGMLRDRPERSQAELTEVVHRDADALAFYRWVRESTPRDAVFVDARSRDHIMVLGRRRLLVGTLFDTARAAFPADEMELRRAIEQDLYGPLNDPAANIERLRDVLRRMRDVHPVSACYIVYRAADVNGDSPRWERLQQAAPDVGLAYQAGGFVALRVEAP